MLYMAGVTSRPGGYGDATVTYIHREEIPSHMYTKHQYKKESECESTVVIYILTKEYKYKSITECDPILHEYYITKGTKFI